MNCGFIDGLDAVDAAARHGVLTIGNFDGVHLGHQRILSAARRRAAAEGAAAVVLTFEPPPDLVIRPADPPQRITPMAQKIELLRRAGADCVVVAKADMVLLSLEPRAFIDEIIADRFAPRCVVEGPNFFFGRERTGNVELLRAAGQAAGFAVEVVEPVVIDTSDGPQCISSTLIRRSVLAGNVELVNRCLGREFTLCGEVIAGQGKGRLLEYPTANIDPAEQVVPADGVYAGWAEVGGGRFLAAVSIGHKPTFGPVRKRAIEAFLLEVRTDFYDRFMALHFVRRLRPQERFESAEALKDQVARDVESVREICGQRL